MAEQALPQELGVYRSLGLTPLPLKARSKEPLVKWRNGCPFKHNLCPLGFSLKGFVPIGTLSHKPTGKQRLMMEKNTPDVKALVDFQYQPRPNCGDYYFLESQAFIICENPRSNLIREAVNKLAADPELRAFLTMLARSTTEGEPPEFTRRLITQVTQKGVSDAETHGG